MQYWPYKCILLSVLSTFCEWIFTCRQYRFDLATIVLQLPRRIKWYPYLHAYIHLEIWPEVKVIPSQGQPTWTILFGSMCPPMNNKSALELYFCHFPFKSYCPKLDDLAWPWLPWHHAANKFLLVSNIGLILPPLFFNYQGESNDTHIHMLICILRYDLRSRSSQVKVNPHEPFYMDQCARLWTTSQRWNYISIIFHLLPKTWWPLMTWHDLGCLGIVQNACKACNISYISTNLNIWWWNDAGTRFGRQMYIFP